MTEVERKSLAYEAFLSDLALLAHIKKGGRHPRRRRNTRPWMFFTFLNCKNDTKPRKSRTYKNLTNLFMNGSNLYNILQFFLFFSGVTNFDFLVHSLQYRCCCSGSFQWCCFIEVSVNTDFLRPRAVCSIWKLTESLF